MLSGRFLCECETLSRYTDEQLEGRLAGKQVIAQLLQYIFSESASITLPFSPAAHRLPVIFCRVIYEIDEQYNQDIFYFITISSPFQKAGLIINIKSSCSCFFIRVFNRFMS